MGTAATLCDIPSVPKYEGMAHISTVTSTRAEMMTLGDIPNFPLIWGYAPYPEDYFEEGGNGNGDFMRRTEFPLI